MDEVFFEFDIPSSVVSRDRFQFDIAHLPLVHLCRIAVCEIYLKECFTGKAVTLKTGVIDYVLQLNDVIIHIENGNDATFAISKDYYSNFLHFKLNRANRTLDIREPNTKAFRFCVNYSSYKKAFRSFFASAIREFTVLYPELVQNTAFLEWSN